MDPVFLSNVVAQIIIALAEDASECSDSQDKHTLLAQIQRNMERFKSEFEVMQAFLKHADSQKDEVAEAWLKRVREVAERVEKVVDEYARIIRGRSKKLSKALHDTFHSKSWSHLGSYLEEREGFSYSISKHTWTPKLSVLQQIADQLKEIEVDLDHILKMKVRWEIRTESL